jgi:PIN domain nuclease of toxin-antitoxin system
MGGSSRLKLLLDTHIWLWLVADPHRLGKHVLQELTSGNHEIWLSPMSTWEILTLHSKGRVRLEGGVEDWLTKAIAGTHEAPLTHEIAIVARQMPLHKDPADRMLAATAQVLDLTLVTADEQLLRLGSIKTLANR